MKNLFIKLIFLFLIISLIGCESFEFSNNDRFSIVREFQVNGETRRAKIYTSVDSENPVPAIIYFHGNNGSANDSEQKRKFHELWPDAVVVYAEGRDLDSNGIGPDGSLSWELRFPYKATLPGGNAQTDDLEYVDQLLEHIVLNNNIDRDRIFAAGHSSGGFFTLSLMEHRSDVIKGFAVLGSFAGYKMTQVRNGNPAVNGNMRIMDLMSPAVGSVDKAKNPRPVFYMFGNQDSVFDGHNPKPNLDGYHATESCWAGITLEQLLIRNNIVPPNGTFWAGLGSRTFNANSSGAPVKYHLYNGTHSWPNAANQWVIDWFKSL